VFSKLWRNCCFSNFSYYWWSKNTDFVPLTVDYEEKYYAAGKIYGSRFVRRESRPTETAILTGRLIDRIIRPLIDQNYRKSIQIVITVLSIDDENDPDFVGLLGASLSLALSKVPFKLASGVRIARKEDDLILMPSYEQRENCVLDAFLQELKIKLIWLSYLEKKFKKPKFINFHK